MRNPLFVESVNILNNLLPSDKKVSKVHSLEDVSTILSNFKTNFSSLEEFASLVAEEKYMKKRLSELVRNFSLDLISLKIGQASLKEFAVKGRKIIADCMNQDKLTTDLYKKIQEVEAMIESVRKLMENPSTDVNMCNNVYQGQIDKIAKYEKEMSKIQARQTQLRNALAPSLDILNQNIKEIDATMVTYDQGPNIDLEKMEKLQYALCTHLPIVNALIAFWKQEIHNLLIAYPDVLSL